MAKPFAMKAIFIDIAVEQTDDPNQREALQALRAVAVLLQRSPGKAEAGRE